MRHGKCWMQTRQSQLTNHNRQLRLSHPLKNRPLQLTNVRRHQCRYAHRRTVPSSGLIAFSPSGVYLRPFVTLFRHFVYAILFKSLRLLRLHSMQALPLPSLAAFITFGYYPDSGSIRATDNSVYVWHIYMLSPCFPLNFGFSCTYFAHFLHFYLHISKYFCIFAIVFAHAEGICS